MRTFVLLAFPAETAAARESRAFDRIDSIELRASLPTPRLRIRTVSGGLDARWLVNALVVVHLVGRPPFVGRVTQWRGDDPCDTLAMLGDSRSTAGIAAEQIPPEGHVTVISGGRFRTFPFLAL